MNKKTMSMSNTQLTLFVVQCILKVDARGSKKSHESFQKKKTTWKPQEFEQCVQTKMRLRNQKSKSKNKILENPKKKKKNETLKFWFNETRIKLFLKTPI